MEPLSISAVVILALPDASKYIVASIQAAEGGIVSKTVTIALQVSILLLGSVAVKITVFGTPTSLHPNTV